jgi:GNAT superfamily N-acetyltransferase
LCASAGLWPGTHFSAGRLRLHDVAVSLDHQRKGIAKAMIIHLARLYDQMPNKYPLYLATQSQSHDAIVLYSRLGFMPYMGQWSRRTKEESEEDWRQVTDILRQKHPSSQS